VKVTILGCGTSAGVPRIGGDWGDCNPNEPKNRRSRVSILVEAGNTAILVDTSPDLRAQCIANDVRTVDAVIWTHDHADHSHGIDDLRQFFHNRGQPMPGYARPQTFASLRDRFEYVFAGHEFYPPTVDEHILMDRQQIGDIMLSVVDMPHGQITSAGLRFETAGQSACYATDFGEVTAAMTELFHKTDLLVVDTLRERPHPTHSHLDQTLGLIAEVQPRHAILTHMDKSLDYQRLKDGLPEGVEPGFDGLTWTI